MRARLWEVRAVSSVSLGNALLCLTAALNAAHGGRACSTWGDFHYKTFDGDVFRFPGLCNYVFSAHCGSAYEDFNLQLRRGPGPNGVAPSRVTMKLDGLVVRLTKGSVLVNGRPIQLPFSQSGVLIEQSNSNLKVVAKLGLVFMWNQDDSLLLELDAKYTNQTCGLCGDFNGVPVYNEFFSHNVKLTPTEFGNLQKMDGPMEQCQDPVPEDAGTCSNDSGICEEMLSSEPFLGCARLVNTSSYLEACRHDLCHCSRVNLTSCLCHTLAEYSRQCAHAGGLPLDWRGPQLCPQTCPLNMRYHECGSPCADTCSNPGRSQLCEDHCVAGCFCPEGMVLDDISHAGCVPVSGCSCVYNGATYAPGTGYSTGCTNCTCSGGRWTCQEAPCPGTCSVLGGAHISTFDEKQYRVHGDCSYVLAKPCDSGAYAVLAELRRCGLTDSETCLKSLTLSLGHTGRAWQCTNRPCLATCAVYGDGHYLTFDGRRYSFSGDCEYTLLQDHCSGNGSAQDSFRVVTENVPCGTTGTTCSKAIKIFLGSYELKLSDGKLEVIETGPRPPYSIRQMGIYLVVDMEMGLVLLWDKGTSIFLRLSPEFKGRVCGLCGNFDDNALNDFTTRSQSVVGDVLEFGNSWKFSPSCPDALAPRDPCTANPSRRSWAQKQCSIINSATFSACHTHVEPGRYYEACVSDACACDSGGDCECFCTAVAAYAQACHEAGVCVSWRTPDVCPLFCDYYNPQGWCQWHYQPCGAPCLKTCRNPSGQCWHDTRGLEGCYPECPAEAPIFDEDQMRCVASCPPPSQAPCHVGGQSFWPNSTVPSDRDCYSCVCTEGGVQCAYDANACVCAYNGRRFHLGDVIYYTTDGLGGCISARCGANGTIERGVHTCSPTTPTPQTTFSFSTSLPGVSSTLPPGTHPSPSESTAHTPSTAPASTPGMASALPSPCCGQDCHWSPWLDVSRPEQGMDSGDFDTLENLRAHGYQVCREPRAVECQAEGAPGVPLATLGQHVECSPTVGLICYNRDQASGHCDNYRIRVLCCVPPACPTSRTETSSPTTFSTVGTGPTTSTPIPGTTTPVPGPSTPVPGISTPVPGTSTPVPDNLIPGKTTLLTPSPVPVSKTISSSTSVLSTAPRPSEPSSPEPTTVTCLQVLCNWTEWIDGSYPGSGRNSGDFDTISNLRAKGYKFCAEPKDVQCRAESFPDTPLQELGQDVICNKSVGLICRNKDQLPPICYNYNIRFLCCELVDTCRTNTTSPATPATTQTPTAEASTTWATGTLSTSTKLSTASSPHVTPSRWGTPSTHEQSSPGTTPCKPKCRWTKWLDVDFPVPGPHGGDNETFGNIMRNGDSICHRPESISKVECRAENHPGVSIHELGQLVQCHQDVGLLCRNQDQKGKTRLCLNYQIRVLCCEPREHCPPPTVTVTSTSSHHLSSYKCNLCVHKQHNLSSYNQCNPCADKQHNLGSYNQYNPCADKQHHLGFYNQCNPCAHKQHNLSSYNQYNLCADKQHSLSSYNQYNLCADKQHSLSSYNQYNLCAHKQHNFSSYNQYSPCADKQHSLSSYNQYNLCADKQHNLSSYNQYNLCAHKQHNFSSYNQYSPCADKQHSLSSYNQYNLCADKQHNLGSYNQSNPCADKQHHLSSNNQCNPCAEKQHNLSSYNELNLCADKQHHHCSNNQCNPCAEKQHNLSSYNELNLSLRPSEPSSPEPTTVTCLQVLCNWTEWIDGSYPGSGRNSGDFDTISNLRAKGYKFCAEPKDVQCRAESFPDTPLQELGQDVICNKSVGLICRNKDQLPPICYNYNIRFLCCELVDTCRTNTTSPATPATTQTPTAEASTTWATGTLSTSTKLSTASSPHVTPSRWGTPSTHEQSSPGTTPCKPKCRWTKWLDVDFPVPGPHGGDNETFGNIMRNGDSICHRPESISKVECRAENHPGVSIHELGQLVQCHQDVGLLCRNQDQKGKTRLCLNYQIRVLCCEPREHCPPPTVTVTSTSSHHLGSYNQYNPCADKQHHLSSYNELNLCADKQHNLSSDNQSNLCAEKQHNLSSNNQSNLCAEKQHNLSSNNQSNLCADKQHHLDSYNQCNPCAHKQCNLSSYNQYNLCADKQCNLGSNNQSNLCAEKQHNLSSYNQCNPCAHKQHNLGSYKCNLCAHKQHNLGSYNELNLCADKQHHLDSYYQCNPCAHKQHNFSSYNQCNPCAHKQCNLSSYNQYNLCADKQHHLGSYNQYNPCAHKQHDLSSYNELNLCADKQHNLSSDNQSNLCAEKQHHLSSNNQSNLCADKQHYLDSYYQCNPCAHKQHNFSSYNQCNPCAHKQHNLSSNNQCNPCADKQCNLGSNNQCNPCADKQHNLSSYNELDLCADKQHHLDSYYQCNPCAHKQHNLSSYNELNLCAHKQRKLSSYNQSNLCSYI
ncbi:hypothetical protein E5288_WYG016035 [Bos mutus]|uniref:VWFD domain-containing protein n=1 Tax=Bos mutus TaxID=72004 RepID=A0A6B0RLS4_9CETA|nr:hypothetical protein [Bos mutus]